MRCPQPAGEELVGSGSVELVDVARVLVERGGSEFAPVESGDGGSAAARVAVRRLGTRRTVDGIEQRRRRRSATGRR